MPDSSPSPPGLHAAYGPFEPEERDELLREWLQGQAPLYCCSSVPPSEWPGEWLHNLATRIDQASRLSPVEWPHQGPWELWQRNGQFSIRAVASHPQRASAVVYPHPESAVGVRRLWQWKRTGAREVWFREEDGWKQCHLPALFSHRFWSKGTRSILGPAARWLNLDTVEGRTRRMLRVSARSGNPGPPEIRYPNLTTPLDQIWPRWIESDNQHVQLAIKPNRALRVVQYIGSLNAGGAERQLCMAAMALARRGHDVRVVTTKELENENGHFHSLLRHAGVPACQAGIRRLSPLAAQELPWHLLRAFPAQLRQNVLALATDLAADRPDVLHCWLDQTNLIGGVAGLLAGVPAIVLGLRSLNPANVPHLYSPYLQPWYATLTCSRRVHLVANSSAAAVSYADWIGIPRERVAVISNGLNTGAFPPSTAQARQQARSSLGLAADDRVVCGILRLSEEKQPELFLDVVRRVRHAVPSLRVLLAGSGPLETHVTEIVRSRGMVDYVQLLGRRADVASLLLAADVALLTSRLEGCPNVSLEAQHLGVPMVATAVGGTPETILHGETGFLADANDADGLARHVAQILTDDVLRARLSAAGPSFIAARFGMERMIDETLALYARALRSHDQSHAADRAAA